MRLSLTSLFFLFMAGLLQANNIQISNVQLTDQNPAQQTVYVSFSISWDNSWKFSSSAPFNYDAAWIFIKFKDSSGQWHHATLTTDPGLCIIPSHASIQTVSDGKGVFLYRKEDGFGTFSCEEIKVLWHYGSDGMTSTDVTTVKVFGIEMVYIPEGSFYAGDGDGINESDAALHINGDNSPSYFLVGNDLVSSVTTNDHPINGNNQGDDDVLRGINGYSGIGIDGDDGIDIDNDGTVDNLFFPTGYHSFYIMKYEVSQGLYCEFLNCLTPEQAQSRVDVSFYGQNRFYIKRASNGLYGCDAGNNAGSPTSADFSRLNEADDGIAIACNYIGLDDMLSFADWAALRPFTELEFEKVCRGSFSLPFPGEHINGLFYTQVTPASGLLFENTLAEIPSNPVACITIGQYLPGPTRVGMFARDTTSRIGSGCAYYGVLDMGGNVWEKVITLGGSNGRWFTGENGDGELDATGKWNVPSWPAPSYSISTNAYGTRGGSYVAGTFGSAISCREFGSRPYPNRKEFFGIRCCR